MEGQQAAVEGQQAAVERGQLRQLGERGGWRVCCGYKVRSLQVLQVGLQRGGLSQRGVTARRSGGREVNGGEGGAGAARQQ